MRKAIQIKGAPSPLGPYSQAILSNKTLYISGQIPMDPITGELKTEDIKTATNQVLKNITSLLNAAEMTLKNVVKCSVFLKDMNDFNQVNEVYQNFFTGVPPARETVEVSKLPLNVNIEISCIAIID
ncbi:MAG: Rid family detoxifying hydrolase [Crocinitomicaceae bacterium]|nr:Rid family detoxifying hydrolase [Crocinitomicaceae bacterium]